MTVIVNWASTGPREYAPSGPHLDLVILGPTWASSGHCSSTWPAGWPQLDLVSGVATWASPIPGDSGPYVGLLDLVNLVLTWSFPDPGTLITTWDSPGPGESGPHLGLTQSW